LACRGNRLTSQNAESAKVCDDPKVVKHGTVVLSQVLFVDADRTMVACPLISAFRSKLNCGHVGGRGGEGQDEPQTSA